MTRALNQYRDTRFALHTQALALGRLAASGSRSYKLDFDRLTVFPAALTLRHTIDERSPLHGATAESLAASNATFVASVVAIETVIPAEVQTQHSYTWNDVRFG